MSDDLPAGGYVPDDEDTIDRPEELLEHVRRARTQHREEPAGHAEDPTESDDDLTVAGRTASAVKDDDFTVVGSRTPPDTDPGMVLDDESTIAPDSELLRRLRAEVAGTDHPQSLSDDDATVIRGAVAPIRAPSHASGCPLSQILRRLRPPQR